MMVMISAQMRALFSTKVFEIMLIGIINKVDKTSIMVNIIQAVQVNACL